MLGYCTKVEATKTNPKLCQKKKSYWKKTCHKKKIETKKNRKKKKNIDFKSVGKIK